MKCEKCNWNLTKIGNRKYRCHNKKCPDFHVVKDIPKIRTYKKVKNDA